MASDAPTGQYQRPAGNYVSIAVEDAGEARRIFDALSRVQRDACAVDQALSTTRHEWVVGASERMFSAHSAAFVQSAPARVREFRAMRGLRVKSPVAVLHVTDCRRDQTGEGHGCRRTRRGPLAAA